MDTKELESLRYKLTGTTPKNNSPNENLVIINGVQGLISQISEMLFKITAKTDKQKAERSMAIEEIDGFEKTTLFELQKAFE